MPKELDRKSKESKKDQTVYWVMLVVILVWAFGEYILGLLRLVFTLWLFVLSITSFILLPFLVFIILKKPDSIEDFDENIKVAFMGLGISIVSTAVLLFVLPEELSDDYLAFLQKVLNQLVSVLA